MNIRSSDIARAGHAAALVTRTVDIPGLRVVSEANQREHWAAKHRRAKSQQHVVALYLYGVTNPSLPTTITLTRFGPKLLDTDNLAGAFKAVRDEIARWCGVDDGSDLYRWEYRQEKGEYGIKIEMMSTRAAAEPAARGADGKR